MKKTALLLVALLAWSSAAAQEEVALPDDWGTLRGTLLMPEAGSGTALLIIAGSGPTDRNGDSRAGIATRCYALLAEALEAEGFASLRYDKRGIAASYCRDSGQLLSDCRFSHYVDDAERMVDLLRERGFRRVVLAGHSEGSLIAFIVAQRAPDKVDAVVSLCGAAYPMDEILKSQLAAQLLTYDMGLLMQANRIIDALKRGGTPDDIPEKLAALFPAYLNRFQTEQMAYDPRQLVRQLTCPVLIVGGGNDRQVTPDNARALQQACPGARTVVIEGMAHTLKTDAGHTAAEQIKAYTDPSQPLADGLAAAIADFLRQTEPASAPASRSRPSPTAGGPNPQ